MKISRYLRKFHLHDSPVNRIRYLPEANRLEFAIQLCDSRGNVEIPEEFYGQAGLLVFEGVNQLKTTYPLNDSSWERFRPEILELEYKPEIDRDELEGVWGLIQLPGRDDKGYVKVLELEFVATYFEWLPENELF